MRPPSWYTPAVVLTVRITFGFEPTPPLSRSRMRRRSGDGGLGKHGERQGRHEGGGSKPPSHVGALLSARSDAREDRSILPRFGLLLYPTAGGPLYGGCPQPKIHGMDERLLL